MYRVYAQDPQARVNVGIRRRLAPLLGNDRTMIEMMNGLLFSLPGTPILYYGDEIGMGDNIYLGDRNARAHPDAVGQRPQRRVLRAPTPSGSTCRHHRPRVPLPGGQRRGPAGEPELAAVVDEAAHRPAPALPGLRPGDARAPAPRQPQGARLPAALRGRADPRGRQPLPLRPVRRARPLRVPGRGPGRAVRQHASSRRSATCPYFITLGPHGFYWFSLEPDRGRAPRRRWPASRSRRRWDDALRRAAPSASSRRSCPATSRDRRWFGDKARTITSAHAWLDAVPVPDARAARRRRWPSSSIVRVELDYGEPRAVRAAARLRRRGAGRGAAPVAPRGGARRRCGPAATTGVLVDAVWRARASRGRCSRCIGRRRSLPGRDGPAGRGARPVPPPASGRWSTRRAAGRRSSAEQSNSSVAFGDRAIVKFIRRFERASTRAWSSAASSSERAHFRHSPG